MKSFRVRYPIIKIVFYASLGYLGYCAYHYYQGVSFKKLTSLTLLKEANRKFSASCSIHQIISIYKVMFKHLHQQRIYPLSQDQVLDCQVQGNKVIENQPWLNYYQMKQRVLINQYNHLLTSKKGQNVIILWIRVKFHEKLQAINKDEGESIIQNALSKQSNKCWQIAFKNSSNKEINNIYLQCIKSTSPIISLITRELHILGQIKTYQSYL